MTRSKSKRSKSAKQEPSQQPAPDQAPDTGHEKGTPPESDDATSQSTKQELVMREVPDDIELPAFGLASDLLADELLPAKQPQQEAPLRDEQPHEVSTEELATVAPEIQLVTFFLEQEEFALPISVVREINRVSAITHVPNSEEYILGVINLRGRVVPVFDLRRRLKLNAIINTRQSIHHDLGLTAAGIDKEMRIIIIDHQNRTLGFLVDRVSQVLTITEDQIALEPTEVCRTDERFISGVVSFEERMVIILDPLPLITRM